MNLLLTLCLTLLPLNAIAASNNDAAIAVLKRNLWIKDAYSAADIMNIGVMPSDKPWDSPMIIKAACSVLRRNKSDINWIRFADIRHPAFAKTPWEAEIAKYDCRDFF